MPFKRMGEKNPKNLNFLLPDVDPHLIHPSLSQPLKRQFDSLMHFYTSTQQSAY